MTETRNPTPKYISELDLLTDTSDATERTY